MKKLRFIKAPLAVLSLLLAALSLLGSPAAAQTNGTAFGSPPYGTGQAGFGQDLSLSNNTTAGTEYVSLPDPGFSSSASWTIEGWFKTSDTNLRVIAALIKPDASANNWFIALNPDGTFGGGVSQGMTKTSGPLTTSYHDGFWHHWALVMQNGTSFAVYIDGIVNTTGTGSYTPVSGCTLYFGGFGSANTLYWNGLLDENRISNVARYTSAFTPPTAPFTTDSSTLGLYHFDGNVLDTHIATVTPTAQAIFCLDSLTYGANASSGAGTAVAGSGTAYPDVVMSNLGPTWEGYNAGISGQQLAVAQPLIQSQIISHFDSAVSTHVVAVVGLTNDIGSTTLTAQQLFALLTTYHDTLRAAGAKTVMTTITPANFASTSPAGTYPRQGSAAFDPIALQENTLIRAHWREHSDALCDPAADARLSNETNLTYYAPDGTHRTDAGYAVYGDLEETAILQAASSSATPYFAPTVSHNTSSQPVLTWPADSAATGYVVCRSVDNRATYQVLATLSSTTLTYTDTTRPSGGTVYYHVVPTH